MNTKTKTELMCLLENLKELTLRLPFEFAAETHDSCQCVIDALNYDETITESK